MGLIEKPYDFIKHITQNKTPVDKFDDSDWKQFIPVYINRALSNNPELLEIIDYIQKFHNIDNKELYSIYKQHIPVDKRYYRNISKSVKEEIDPKQLDILQQYYKLSLKEIKENYNILDKNELERILSMYGYDENDLKNEKKGTKNNKGNKTKKTKRN